MSLKVTLALERQRRKEAEAEVARLRTLLETVDTASTTLVSSPEAAHNLARVVSQLKQTEQQLEDQQGLVRLVIDNSPNLVYVEDQAGRCILANKRYIELLEQQISPASVEEESPASPDTDPTEAISRPIVTTSFEECYHLKDGQTVWYYTTKSPLAQADGSDYILTFSSDITDLKRAHQVAEESVQARQLFMANMSHEIRTPLHGIMGLADLLKKEPLSTEQTDYVDMIKSSTENLLVVINDILDFAKIESGKISLENIPFDVLSTVQNAARSLSFKSDEKGLLLRIVSPEAPLPLATGDPFRLHQVLVNLISNAIKFTRQGAITITIDASQCQGSSLPITFSVADTGIGISPENISQIFNSFRQADSSIPRLYGGTGLGLTICKNLIELQGGSIEVESELGRGSCFRFTIPYAVSEAPLTENAAVIKDPNLLQGLTVLLAEDNAVNQLIGVSMLGQWKVRVEMAQNGEEALLKSSQSKYDLILMDVQMPMLDGIEATARLRAAPGPNQHVPIIALSADAIRINAGSYQSLGFTHYLTKPYTDVALYNLLAQVSKRAPGGGLPLPEEPAAPAELGLHYDFNLLGKLGNDPVFIYKILELFVERVPQQVRSLQDAIERNDWPTVAQEAHSLKTTFGSLNIQPETNHLKKLEALAETTPIPSKSEFYTLATAISKATPLFIDLFSKNMAKIF
ncbi:response regulator [Hymenobacter sp. BT186]|uniref:histidine kinase n=1 Tax=Hymenobacter telluris TaxID=2816474 RepID=A0A939JC05_9BACT|nr:PAS domain-containing hybrid sensor histidine kinase/response regulator [Hymenobacter telluris]MBO0356817.1 response regulator [Hymenobacter telluris]MBW3372843.1 response regulator [Hymenobacter norwichensis]